MGDKPEHWYVQSAALPLAVRNGKLSVMLVTSRGKGAWILPKGIVERDMGPGPSAAKEAWEEAGLRGEMAPASVGTYEKHKWGGVCRIDVFPMRVTEESGQYPEKSTRKRKWFSIEEAVELMSPDGAGDIVQTLIPRGRLLTLVRHAKSSWKEAELGDFDRPLNSRGKRDAPEMAKRLAENLVLPELIISSPAKRAKKTLAAVTEALRQPEETVELDEEIYGASLSTLLSLVRSLPGDARHVMLVGHNPGLTELADTLLAKGSIINIPTSGVVRLELSPPEWAGAGPGTARLVEFDYPKKHGEHNSE